MPQRSRITYTEITTDDRNLLALVSVTFSPSHTHIHTHLPFVLCLTQKRGRWSTLIKCSRCPCSLWYRGEKETFHFHLSVVVILEPLIFFYEAVSWRQDNMVSQQYNLKPTTDKQSQHLSCALATTSVLQAENRWLGEDLANTKTGDFLFSFFFPKRYTHRLDYFNTGRSWGG